MQIGMTYLSIKVYLVDIIIDIKYIFILSKGEFRYIDKVNIV